MVNYNLWQVDSSPFSCGSRLMLRETVPTVAAVHDICRFRGGTLNTTRRRHANNDARDIDNFIGCEGDFPI